MRPNETNLTILIEDSEGISFSLEYDSNSLHAKELSVMARLENDVNILELHQIMKFVIAHDVSTVSDLSRLTKVLREN